MPTNFQILLKVLHAIVPVVEFRQTFYLQHTNCLILYIMFQLLI